MQPKNKTRSIMTQLGHDDSRIKEIYKVTDFDRILRKLSLELQLDQHKKEYTTENWVKLLLWSQVQGFSKIRPYAKQLGKNTHWRLLCGMTQGAPVQSQISRRLEDENLHELLDRMFLTYQQLIPRKSKYFDFKPTKWQTEVLRWHYRPFIIDCTANKLSPLRYDYTELGYVAGMPEPCPSARLNVMLDLQTTIPVNYQTAHGNQHESPLTDELLTDIAPLKAWLQDFVYGRILTPLLIMDRGYWKIDRFIQLSKQGWGWMIPWKNQTFVKVQYEMLSFPNCDSEPLEILVWHPACKVPWRRIIGKISPNDTRHWDILTSDHYLKAQTALLLQQNRWTVEEFFSWIKKQTCFKQPLGTTWASYVTHCFLIILLYIILIYFILLCGFGRWQNCLTDLLNDLRYSDAESWSCQYSIPSWELSSRR